MDVYLRLFMAFFKVGMFAFGGGYAMLPMFRRELIEKNSFLTEEDLLDYYSLSQCIPGIIAVNVSIFTGYKVNKIKGAFVSVLAMVLPSLIIILAIANILNRIDDNEVLKYALSGIRVGVVALIVNEIIYLFKKEIKCKYHLSIFIITALLLFMFHLNAVFIVGVSVLIAVFHFFYIRKLKK